MRLARTQLSTRWELVALFAIAVVVYARRSPPSVQEWDQAEFQVLAWKVGLPHATGYPLYIWLGKLFTLVPVFEPAFRVTLVSCVAAALGITLVARTVTVYVGPSPLARIAAVASALALGSTRAFAHVATLSEMYALQALLTVLFIWLVLAWQRDSRIGCLYAAAIVLGLVGANHASGAAIVPVAFVAFALAWKRLSWVHRVLVPLVVLTGVATFNVFLFWLLWRRHQPIDHWHATILSASELFGLGGQNDDSFWRCFWFTASAEQFRHAQYASTLPWVSRVGMVLHRYCADASPLFVVVAAAGVVTSWRDRRREAIVLFVALVSQLTLVVGAYDRHHKANLYLVAADALLAIYGGIFLARAADSGLRLVAKRFPRVQGVRGLAIVGSALVALALLERGTSQVYDRWLGGLSAVEGREFVLARDAANLRRDRRDVTWPRDGTRRLLESIPRGAVVFSPWTDAYQLQYLSLLDRGEPLEIHELIPTNPRAFTIAAQYRELLVSERPVFFLDGALGVEQVKHPMDRVGEHVLRLRRSP